MSNFALDGAGSSGPAIPDSIGEIDSQWLRAVLEPKFPGIAVEDFTLQIVGTGVGLMGLLYRVTLHYADVDQARYPASIIVKLPSTDESARMTAAAYRFYEKEVSFYRDLASMTTLKTPIFHFGAHDPSSDNFVLALEDLGHQRSADQLVGCDKSDADSAMKALARHHAHFWDDPAVLSNGYPWLPFGSDPPTPQIVEMVFTSAWSQFVDFMGPEMDERILPLGSWIPANLDALLAMPEGRACTVLHGDYRLDNLFFDHDGEVTVLDWQIVTKGFGGYDFGYFVSQSLSVEARRTHVNDLAALYLHELAQQGVSYDEADFWYDVHRTFIFCLFYPISLMLNDLSNERTVALVKEMARRSMSAIIDSGALALVQGTYNGA